jgi:hypothetical protein
MGFSHEDPEARCAAATESLHAVALRSQRNQCGMVMEGRKAYGRALLLLAGVSGDHAMSDPVLAAVYLLFSLQSLL